MCVMTCVIKDLEMREDDPESQVSLKGNHVPSHGVF